MKPLLLTTIAAVVLVGWGESPSPSPPAEVKSESTSLYSLDSDWPKLQTGIALGQVTGVAVDSHNHVFVFHRSDRTWIQPFPKEKIKGHTIAMFKGETGELIKTFGEDKLIMPHGLSVDPQGNVWVTDVGSQQIHKLSHEDGTVLLNIGESGGKEVTELLIANGADVNVADMALMTPLHFAVVFDHKEIAELLIANGADVNANDIGGGTPLDYANGVVANFLRKHGGKTGEELKAEGK